MLGQLRKHGKSIVTKSILGIMAFGLIFYFGYAGVRKHKGEFGSGVTHPIATVNGESIPRGKFQYSYENQLKFYEQLTQGGVPPALQETLKQSVLEKLIQTKIFAQQARSLGMEVSDKELAQEIAMNQAFYRDGFFQKKYYLEQFKPTYERQTGEDYETNLKEDLLAEKFENLIRDSTSLTVEELMREFRLTHTELNLQKVSLDTASWTDDKEAKAQEAESEILAVLKLPAFPKGPNPLEALKKKYNLKIEETGFHSLRDKAVFTGDPEADEAFACIFKLTPADPVCPKGFSIGNQTVFFKLLGRKDPDMSQFEAEKEALKKNLLPRRQTMILKQIADSLIRQASIQVNMKR